MIEFLMNWIWCCYMWADDAVNAINLSELSVYKKLNSSYDENTALYIHSPMAEQVACCYMRHLAMLMKGKSNCLMREDSKHTSEMMWSRASKQIAK